MKITRVQSAIGARLLAAVASGVLLSLEAAADGDWPGWRGAGTTGVVAARPLPVRWSATENVKWKVPLPERGNSTPIVSGDRVFLTQAIEDEKMRTVMCFRRSDGRLLWQRGVRWDRAEESHPTNPYCSASPVTDGERVIAWFGSAGVVCYDLDGRELWRRDLGPQRHEWGYGSSPLIHGQLCILYHGPADPGALVALNVRTGEVVWRVEEPRMIKRPRTDGFRGNANGIVGTFASPILVNDNGRGVVLMNFPQWLCAYDATTGEELWRCAGVNELVYASPVAEDGVVVAMGGFLGTTIAVRMGGSGDVTETHRLWLTERTKNRLGSAVVRDGHIYILNTPGVAECIELQTGKVVWEERLPKIGATGESWSSMVLAGDLIYILNQSGDTVVLKAEPKFEVVSVNPLDGVLTNASHAVAGGELFIRTHKHLWCVRESE